MTLAYWVEKNHDDIRWNGRLLTITQGFLLLGLAGLGLAIIL